MFQNFSSVMVLDLSIKEDKEQPLFLERRNKKPQNGFFAIDSHGRYIFVSILRFEIGLEKTKLLQFEDLGQ